jgi:hypothetical protein
VPFTCLVGQKSEYGTFSCSQVIGEWMFAAAVIDRLQLIVFLLVTFVGAIYFFVKTPYIFEHVIQSEITEKLARENISSCR